MKYVIQYFKAVYPDLNIGQWRNIAYKDDDLEKAKEIAASIAKGNKINAVKVRVLEVLMELDCVDKHNE